MSQYQRRLFLKMMGGFSAAMLTGLPQNVFAGNATSTRKTKRIAVEEHISWQEYSDYLSNLEEPPSYEQDMKNNPEMMAMMQKQGGLPPTDVLGDLANIDMRLKDMDVIKIGSVVLQYASSSQTSP